MKQTKIQKLINALRKRNLTVREIASRFSVPNVYAIIHDVRRNGYNVSRTTTRTGITAYRLVA
jgi:predicted RNase H-like nuclease